MIETPARIFQKLLDGRLDVLGPDLVEGSAKFDLKEGIRFTGCLHGAALTILARWLVANLLAHFVPQLLRVVLDFGAGFIGVLLDFLFGFLKFVFGEIRVFLSAGRQTRRNHHNHHNAQFQGESSLSDGRPQLGCVSCFVAHALGVPRSQSCERMCPRTVRAETA